MIKLIAYPRRKIFLKVGTEVFYKDRIYKVESLTHDTLIISDGELHCLYFDLNKMDCYVKSFNDAAKENPILKEHIEFLGLPNDAEKTFHEDSINTIGDLISKSHAYLKKDLGLKNRLILEVKEVLEENGLSLADD